MGIEAPSFGVRQAWARIWTPLSFNALKLAGVTMSGVDAKFIIQDGKVKVNGEVDTRRGRKLYDGDKFEYDGKE